jgi:hypothetical protein
VRAACEPRADPDARPGGSSAWLIGALRGSVHHRASAIIVVRHMPPAAGRCVRSYSFVTSDDVRCLITNYAVPGNRQVFSGIKLRVKMVSWIFLTNRARALLGVIQDPRCACATSRPPELRPQGNALSARS